MLTPPFDLYSGLGDETRKKRELGQQFLQSLLDSKLEDCCEKIQLMKNVVNLEDGGISKLVVIRDIVQKFWKAAFKSVTLASIVSVPWGHQALGKL
jgi:hypothetical protein